MARIHVQEVGPDRRANEIADPEPQQVPVEGQRHIGIRDHQHGVAHAKRAGAEPRDVAAGPERRIGQHRSVECLEPVAVGIAERDQVGDETLVGEGLRFALHGNASRFKRPGQRVERGGIGHLPSEQAFGVHAAVVDDESLAPVVHAECATGSGAIDLLQAELAGGEISPRLEVSRADADIAERLNSHEPAPAVMMILVRQSMSSRYTGQWQAGWQASPQGPAPQAGPGRSRAACSRSAWAIPA